MAGDVRQVAGRSGKAVMSMGTTSSVVREISAYWKASASAL